MFVTTFLTKNLTGSEAALSVRIRPSKSDRYEDTWTLSCSGSSLIYFTLTSTLKVPSNIGEPSLNIWFPNLPICSLIIVWSWVISLACKAVPGLKRTLRKFLSTSKSS